MTRIFLWPAILLAVSSCSEPDSPRDPWPGLTGESKPWVRWWWPGSEVDSQNLSGLIQQYADAGFGGVEITPVYGVRGHEEHYLWFLTPEWIQMLDHSVKEAEKQGMGVDMNLGTGWPFGGPQITAGHAASRFLLETFQMEPGVPLDEKVIPRDPGDRGEGVFLEALMAYASDGTVLDVTGSVEGDGTLVWVPDHGKWTLYAVFCGKTRQQVKRAAPGGEGYSMDHFSSEAVDAYLDRFEKAFSGRRGVRAFFNDSYEVYNASWTPGLFDEFRERRGYDLRNHLDAFTGETEPSYAARVKSDYRQTLAELLYEHFTVIWTSWSHQRGSLTRNQAHGSPGNLLDLYAAVDIPECESYGHRIFQIPGLRNNPDDTVNVEPDPMMLKLATSAAHVTNKPLVSNETFTWLGEHFRVALSQCKPEVEDAFLAGINHVFYHGTTYSPAGAPWPGWLFYASVHFGPTNSFWPHLPGLNRYVARCQSILQSGHPDNEILVYWPVFDIWYRPEGFEMQLSVHNIQDWLVYPGIERMAHRGYSYDFISDQLLEQVETAGDLLQSAGGAVSYRGLVIPACRFMPVSTMKTILELAREGGTVVFERLPEDVPGYNKLDERREELRKLSGQLEFRDIGRGIMKCSTGKGAILLCKDPDRALEYAGISGESIGDFGLKFTRRSMENGKYYFLANHGGDPVDTLLPLNTQAASVLIMDPLDGRSGYAAMEKEGTRTGVRIQLLPGRSLFLRTFNTRPGKRGDWVYEISRHQPYELEGRWELSFLTGGPEIPGPRSLDSLQPWTCLEDQGVLDFSGTAAYTLTFRKPDIMADRWLLDLGNVHESALVRLNGKVVGIVWSVPFEIDVTRYLREGDNLLVIEVANLMGNRIRCMDREEILWKNFHDINFVNIAYSPFDASDWDTEPSGLEGPVRLIPVDTGR
jgi:hypothetical protein